MSQECRNRVFTLKPVLLTLALLLVAMASSAAVSPVDGKEYPEHDALVFVYNQMRDSGFLAPDAPTEPDLETLQQTFDEALAVGFVEAISEDEAPPTQGFDEIDLGFFEKPDSVEPLSRASRECDEAAVGCVVKVGGFALVCAAELIASSAVGQPWWGLGACAIEMADLGVDECADTNTYCNPGVQTPSTWHSQFVGRDYGSSQNRQTQTCGAGHRVNRYRVYWDNHYSWGIRVIAKIRFYCTSGTQLNWGNNNSWDSYGGSRCGNGNLMQGFDVRAGALIDGTRAHCDPAKDTTTSDWLGGWKGGTGGAQYERLCPEGKYLWGADVMWGNNANTSRNYIHGFTLLCK